MRRQLGLGANADATSFLQDGWATAHCSVLVNFFGYGGVRVLPVVVSRGDDDSRPSSRSHGSEDGLPDGGSDILVVETMFDTLSAKAALYAIGEYLECSAAWTSPSLYRVLSLTNLAALCLVRPVRPFTPASDTPSPCARASTEVLAPST